VSVVYVFSYVYVHTCSATVQQKEPLLPTRKLKKHGLFTHAGPEMQYKMGPKQTMQAWEKTENTSLPHDVGRPSAC